MKRFVALALALGGLAACASPSTTTGTGSPTPTVSVIGSQSGTPSPTQTGTPAKTLTITRAKIKLNHHYDVFWCDPDSYPIARPEEQARKNGVQWYDSQDPNSEEIQAIKEDLGLPNKSKLSDDDKYRVYQLHKKLSVISVSRGGPAWIFRLTVSNGKGNAEQVTGTVDEKGTISETSRKQTRASCPICLSSSTLIDSPRGPVAVRAIRAGDRVYTTNARGRRIVRVVTRTVRRPAAPGHLMLRLALADGRTLVSSPRHPSAGGRPLGSFGVGEKLNGSTITGMRMISSDEDATYDLLPSGPTGDYWANGILIGSTLSA